VLQYVACLVVKYVKQESVTVFSITASRTIPNRTLHRADCSYKINNQIWNIIYFFKKAYRWNILETISSSPHFLWSLETLIYDTDHACGDDLWSLACRMWCRHWIGWCDVCRVAVSGFVNWLKKLFMYPLPQTIKCGRTKCVDTKYERLTSAVIWAWPETGIFYTRQTILPRKTKTYAT